MTKHIKMTIAALAVALVGLSPSLAAAAGVTITQKITLPTTSPGGVNGASGGGSGNDSVGDPFFPDLHLDTVEQEVPHFQPPKGNLDPVLIDIDVDEPLTPDTPDFKPTVKPVGSPQAVTAGLSRHDDNPPQLACRFVDKAGLKLVITNTGGMVTPPERLEVDATGDGRSDLSIKLRKAGLPENSRYEYPVMQALDISTCRVWQASVR